MRTRRENLELAAASMPVVPYLVQRFCTHYRLDKTSEQARLLAVQVAEEVACQLDAMIDSDEDVEAFAEFSLRNLPRVYDKLMTVFKSRGFCERFVHMTTIALAGTHQCEAWPPWGESGTVDS